MKGQFFTITAILILIVVVSIVEILTIPMELSSKETRFETEKFIGFKSFKESIEEILNQIKSSWIFPKYNYKIKLEITNNINYDFEEIPINIDIDFNDFTNPDSIRVFNGIKEIPSQVKWTNFSLKRGTIYFYSSFESKEKKNFTVFYNTHLKEKISSQIPSYENVNITKDGNLINVSAKRYIASINLTEGGTITYLLNKINNENICTNFFMVNSTGLQNLTTAKLSSESHNPIFSEVRIETNEFGEINATLNTTYRFFNDRITALINVSYKNNSPFLEIINYFTCPSNWTMKMENATQTDWCGLSQSNEIDNTADSWVSFYSNDESMAFLTNYTKWDYAGSEPTSVHYGSISVGNNTYGRSFSYFKSTGSNISKVYGELTLYFKDPRESSNWPKFALFGQYIPWESKYHIYDFDDILEKRNSFLENENSLLLKEIKLKEEKYDQLIEYFAYQSNWYSSPFNYRNITIREDSGSDRTNITIILSISSNTSDASKDFHVPLNTKPSSFRLYDSQDNKVLINLTWEDESILDGNVSFLVNISASRLKKYVLYYSSITQAPFEYEKNTENVPAANINTDINPENTTFKNDFSYRIPFYIQDIGDIKRTNWFFEKDFYFNKDVNPSSIVVSDESNEILLTDVSTDNLDSFSEFNLPLKDEGDGLIYKLYNLEERPFNISFWKFNFNETESPNMVNITIKNPKGVLIEKIMNSNISTHGLEFENIMINSTEMGVYELIVNATGESSIKVNSTLPKLIYEKNKILIGKIPSGTSSTGWNGSFIIHIPESEDSLNITVYDLGDVTTGKINITYKTGEVMLKEDVPATSTSYLKPIKNFENGRLLKASIASGSNSSIKITFLDVTNMAYDEDYYLDFNEPKLNVLFISSLSRKSYKKHWVYFDDFKRSKLQSSDLTEDNLRINNSYYSWNLTGNNFTLVNRIDWFNQSESWFSGWGFGINKTTSSSTSLSNIKLTQSNKVRKVAKASSGTSPSVNYYFNFYAYSPLIKVVIKDIKSQNDFSLGPYWMINNDDDKNFTYRFGKTFVDNNQENDISYYNLTCKDYTWFFKRDQNASLGIIAPCDELLGVMRSFYMVDNLTDSLTTVSIKGMEDNYIYLLPSNNTQSSFVEETMKKIFYKNMIKQADKINIRYYEKDFKVIGEIIS